MKRISARPLIVSLCAALTSTVLVPGCGLDLIVGGGSSAEGSGAVRPNEVLVRFINRTLNEAVDVQFHATNEPLESLPDDLFVEENLLRRGIGLAGSGILGPRQGDQITFPCTADLTIGTAGGQFLDAETGDERGVGQPRWVQESPLGLCGFVVTIEFFTTDRDFGTRIALGE